MNKIRFGLIGCGDIAHIRYFYSIPHFEEIELVGIYDMNKPFLQKTAEELGVKAYNSYEEMLDDPNHRRGHRYYLSSQPYPAGHPGLESRQACYL